MKAVSRTKEIGRDFELMPWEGKSSIIEIKLDVHCHQSESTLNSGKELALVSVVASVDRTREGAFRSIRAVEDDKHHTGPIVTEKRCC